MEFVSVVAIVFDMPILMILPLTSPICIVSPTSILLLKNIPIPATQFLNEFWKAIPSKTIPTPIEAIISKAKSNNPEVNPR